MATNYFDLSRPIEAARAFLPYIRFNADIGRWTDHTRVPGGAGEWIKRQRELVVPFILCADFGTVESGQLSLAATPDFQYLRPFGQPAVALAGPVDGYRPGMRLKCLVKGLGLRHFSANSEAVCEVIRHQWDAFARSPEAMAGRLPCWRVLPSTSYFNDKLGKPVFKPVVEVLGWIDRHETFGPRTVPVPIPKPTEQSQLDIDRSHAERLSQDIPYTAAPDNRLPQTGSCPDQSSRPQFDPDLDDVIPF